MIYSIPDDLIRRETSGARKSLDQIEGEGDNYVRTDIAGKYPGARPLEERVITYVVKKPRSGLQTSLDYVRHIFRGLREHNMTKDYLEYVRERVMVNNPGLREAVESL